MLGPRGDLVSDIILAAVTENRHGATSWSICAQAQRPIDRLQIVIAGFYPVIESQAIEETAVRNQSCCGSDIECLVFTEMQPHAVAFGGTYLFQPPPDGGDGHIRGSRTA